MESAIFMFRLILRGFEIEEELESDRLDFSIIKWNWRLSIILKANRSRETGLHSDSSGVFILSLSCKQFNKFKLILI